MVKRPVRRPLIHALLIALFLTASLEPVHADPGPHSFVPGEVLVKFHLGLSPEEITVLVTDYRIQVVEDIPTLGVWRLRVEPGREQVMARALGALPQVLYAEPNYRAWTLVEPPDDPYYVLQWNLDKVQLLHAWEITRGDPSMPMAIIDTGIDLSHPDLVAKLWVNPGEIPHNDLDDDGNGYIDDVHGYDFVNEDGEPEDDYGLGHGTHVSGIAAAATDNGLGVAGVAPANPLMALKVLDSSGEGTYFDVARAIDYALAQGVRVMNLSLGGIDASDLLSDAVQAATAAGALMVAAAGNCSSGCIIEGQYYVNPVFYPAAYDEVLAVGATDSSDGIASFSEHHPYVDVTAPGVSAYSTYRYQGESYPYYGYMSGTSMSTPHTSGLAALLWAADPTLTREEVVECVVASADDLGTPGKDDYYGWGRINARSALCAATAALSVTPSLLTFMADAHSLSVPVSRTVQIANSGCITLTWTATISPPSASWVHFIPMSGTLAQGGSQPLRVEVDPTELGEAYGDYTSQVHFTPVHGTGEAATVSGTVVDIHLHYVPLIYQRIFLLVYKNAGGYTTVRLRTVPSPRSPKASTPITPSGH